MRRIPNFLRNLGIKKDDKKSERKEEKEEKKRNEKKDEKKEEKPAGSLDIVDPSHESRETSKEPEEAELKTPKPREKEKAKNKGQKEEKAKDLVPHKLEPRKKASKCVSPAGKKATTPRSKASTEAQGKSGRNAAAAPTPTGSQVVSKWAQRALDMGVDALRDEYRALAKYTLPEMTTEAFAANHEAGRNRYQDVPCQDQHRIVNKWPGASTDYVHANYVGTPMSPKRFICTQGPLDVTINDFWMMVVQEEAETIVMLCNCIETGKLKCAQYWPLNVGEVRKYEPMNFAIMNTEMRTLSLDEPTVILTVLQIKFTHPESGKMETRLVRHYQWQDWPDRGVPPCRLTAMELLSSVRGNTKPIIVHCSAGIGRTGTIVAIEYILERMQAGVECVAMSELLKELRNQRAYTIQNDIQYLYIHRVLLFYFLEKHKARYESFLTEENTVKYKKFVEDYNGATGM